MCFASSAVSDRGQRARIHTNNPQVCGDGAEPVRIGRKLARFVVAVIHDCHHAGKNIGRRTISFRKK